MNLGLTSLSPASSKRLKNVLIAITLILTILLGVSPTIIAKASPSALGTIEFPITVAPGDQLDPSISGRFVSYTDRLSGDADIWYYDDITGSVYPVMVGPGNQELSDISRTTIVYTDFALSNGDIKAFDISTGLATPITLDPASQSNPALSDFLVAWEDLRGVDRDIWIGDLLLGGERPITGQGDQNSPSVSGSRVAYIDGGEVKVFDAFTGVTATVFSGPAINPDIDGDHVTFADVSICPSGSCNDLADVAVYDASGASLARLALPGDQINPHISGDWVSFEDLGSGASHVGLWHWTNGDVHFPTPNTSEQTLSDISGNRVVYTDNRNGNLDIFALDFSIPTPTVAVVPASVTGGLGSTFTVELDASGITEPLVGYDVELTWNVNSLTLLCNYVDFDSTTIIAGSNHFSIIKTCGFPNSGYVRYAVGTLYGATVNGNGALLKIPFEVTGPIDSPLTIVISDLVVLVNGISTGISPTVQNGMFTFFDTTPPDTSIDSAVDGNGNPIYNGTITTSTTAVITLFGTDNVGGPSTPVAGFECSLDGASFTACTSPVTLTGLTAGTHEFRARAFDSSGNTDPWPAVITWTVVPVSTQGSCFSVTVTVDADGSVVITGTDSSGNIVVRVILPPGTFLDPAGLSFICGMNGANTVFEMTGASVPYPPGKTIIIASNPGSNFACVVDTPTSVLAQGLPQCTGSNPDEYAFLCDGQPHTNPANMRTYTCTQIMINHLPYMQIDHLANTFVMTMSIQAMGTVYFTDGNGNPLSSDTSGAPKVDVILNNGKVKGTNPGQVLAWFQMMNTGSVPLQSFQLNGTLPIDWTAHPPWMPAQGAVHVYYAYANGTRVEITGQANISVSSTSIETVQVEVADTRLTAATTPIEPGDAILVSVKIAYSLLGTSQTAASYPRTYNATIDSSAWTLENKAGLTTISSTSTSSFNAYAKVLGDVNGDLKVNILDAAMGVLGYGTRPRQEAWDPRADLNSDDIVDILDIAIIAYYYGSHA